MSEVTCFNKNNRDCKNFNFSCPSGTTFVGGTIEANSYINSMTEIKCKSNLNGEITSTSIPKQGDNSRAFEIPFCSNGFSEIEKVFVVDDDEREEVVKSLRFKCNGSNNFGGKIGGLETSTSDKTVILKCNNGQVINSLNGQYGIYDSQNVKAWLTLNNTCGSNEVVNINSSNLNILTWLIIIAIIFVFMMFIFY